MFAGIEIGGTKIVMAVGNDPSDMSPSFRIPTADPATTMQQVVDQLKAYEAEYGRLAGIGIASFGPISVSPDDPEYGSVLRTPKPGWSGYNILAPIERSMPGVPIHIDTDVNGAALAENRWGSAQGLDDFAYVTVGTGVGIGIISGGRPIHGLLHPEAGHILVVRDKAVDPYVSRCPFHSDCLEGLACGPSILDRTGLGGQDLPQDHPIWEIIGGYLAQLYYTLTLTVSPRRILVGGSVGLRQEVLDISRERLRGLLGGYVEALESPGAIDNYLQAAGLRNRAGVAGAVALARTTNERCLVTGTV